MDDMVYIPKIIHTKTGGFMFLSSVSRKIKSTTAYYESPELAGKMAQKFIGDFVASYNKEKENFEPDSKELAKLTDYSYEIVPFPRKEMMLLKLKGKQI